MKKRSVKSKKTAARKPSTASTSNKLRIINRHAVGIDTDANAQVLNMPSIESPETISKNRFTVLPVIKKRLTRKHEAKK